MHRLVTYLGIWLLLGTQTPGQLVRGAEAQARIELMRTPNGGIQPQAQAEAAGGIHVLYYKGDPRGGDLFYVRQSPRQTAFSPPVKVNSRPASAIAMGTIRGGQLAVGRHGRVHVIWNGSSAAQANAHKGAPLLYAHLSDNGLGFEPERDLITYAAGLDGGSSIAADRSGNVYAAWHAHVPGRPEEEEGRAVFLAISRDGGKTFSRERPVSKQGAGACACCGMRALADAYGGVYLLFRGASALTNRDELLLVSHDRGETFDLALSDPWKTGACPMSSAWLANGKQGVLAGWETAGQVYYTKSDLKTGAISRRVAAPGSGNRKHPVVVQNRAGMILMVWTEGTGWEKGGAVAWQLFDPAGRPTAEHGKAEGVPVWSMAAAVARPDGSFLVIY